MTTKMTKMHFEAIAESVKPVIEECVEPNEKCVAAQVARRLAGNLIQFNPAFDRVRFLTACGVEDWMTL